MVSVAGIYVPAAGRGKPEKKKRIIMSINGPLRSELAGTCLTHEHIMVDFSGADKINPGNWDLNEAFSVVKPYLENVLDFGVLTFFDATPAYLGRSPELLMRLSSATGIFIVTNTGYYGAKGNKYLPEHAFSETAGQLAARWVEEWKRGIDGTPVKPGFIKIGVDKGPLSKIHKKLVEAAAQTHLQTGLTVASHTTGWEAAFEQMDLLNQSGVSSEAFVWVHAQEEKDLARHLEAARNGAWISLDGVRENNASEYVEMMFNLKKNDLMHKILISQDAGWYTPGEKRGGSFTPYTAIFLTLIPLLREKDFSLDDIDRIMVQNPADAFSIGVKNQ